MGTATKRSDTTEKQTEKEAKQKKNKEKIDGVVDFTVRTRGQEPCDEMRQLPHDASLIRSSFKRRYASFADVVKEKHTRTANDQVVCTKTCSSS
jgi:hypothetical protein